MIFKDLKIGDYFKYSFSDSVFRKIYVNRDNCGVVCSNGYLQSGNFANEKVIKCDRDGKNIVEYLTIDEIPAGSYFRDDYNIICFKPFKSECTVGYSNIAIVISGHGYSKYTIIKVTSARIFLIVDKSEIKDEI